MTWYVLDHPDAPGYGLAEGARHCGERFTRAATLFGAFTREEVGAMAAALNQCAVRDRIRTYCEEGASLAGMVPDTCTAQIAEAATLLTDCFRRGGKLLLCGNGGSAADCQHLAAEFTGRMGSYTNPLPALALTTDTSFLTAWANDAAFAGVFARQVEALGKPGDVLLAISTSGTSPNVVAALVAAHRGDLATILLAGAGPPDTRLDGMASVVVSVPSRDTQHIQEAHILIGHLLCLLVREAA